MHEYNGVEVKFSQVQSVLILYIYLKHSVRFYFNDIAGCMKIKTEC